MQNNSASHGIAIFLIETIWSSKLFWNLLIKPDGQIKNGQTDVDMVLACRPAITGYFRENLD